MPDSLLFTEWMFSSDYIGGHWISYSEPVSELLTQEHTHDPIGCAGGRGVRCGDEWWSAGVASVETGHGRKTGIDVWRDRVRGVTLEDEKQKRSFFSPKCVWRRKNWFICWILYSLLTSPRPWWSKIYWGVLAVKRGQHLQPPCDAWPAEGRQADKTRSNTDTMRVSSVFTDNNQTET